MELWYASRRDAGVNNETLPPAERLCGGSDWTPEAAVASAGRHGILLTPVHWQILGFAREECLRTRHVPDVDVLASRTGISRNAIERLFPGGADAVIAEIAGMALPEGAREREPRDGTSRKTPPSR